MNLIKALIAVTALCLVFAHAQTPETAPAPAAETAPAVAAEKTGSGPEGMRIALTELRSDLMDAYQKYAHKGQKAAELYMNALGKIDITQQFLLKNYKKAEGGPNLQDNFGMSRISETRSMELFDACQKVAEAAIIQLEKDEIDAQLAEIAAKRDSLHNELGKIYATILESERGRAADLKSKLDRQAKEAKRLRAEMLRRFKSLQSALIKVRQDARGTIISMSDILFGFDKADITAELKTPLAKIAGILIAYQNFRVAVEGHTDSKGTAKYNLDLSRRRAGNVRNFLVEQGVKAKRLKAIGYGFRRPVATNRTKAGRQKNRRVDIVVIDKKRY
jgi:outer membrane protein OmpA-like peptidoglycan-associated protein